MHNWWDVPTLYINGASFENVTSPLCGRISKGSLAFTAGATSKMISGDNVFQSMATHPFTFVTNVDAMYGSVSEGVGYSLTVTWSC